jgi:hypothetical protein
MGDQNKIAGLRKRIRDLEIKLDELVETRARQTGYSKAEIMLELDDIGYLTTTPVIEPKKYDPDGQLRRLAYKLTELAKALRDEEAKP